MSDSSVAPDLIGRDLHCIGCGYNLRALPASARCPECGNEVERSLRLIRRPAAVAAAFTAAVAAAVLTSVGAIFLWAAGSLTIQSGRTIVRVTQEAVRPGAGLLQSAASLVLFPAVWSLRWGCGLAELHGMRGPLNALAAVAVLSAGVAAAVWLEAIRLPAESPPRLDLGFLAGATVAQTAVLCTVALVGARLASLLGREALSRGWRTAGRAGGAAFLFVAAIQLGGWVLKLLLEGHETWYALPPWLAGTAVLVGSAAATVRLLPALRAAIYAAPLFRRELLDRPAERRMTVDAVRRLAEGGGRRSGVGDREGSAGAAFDAPRAEPAGAAAGPDEIT
jgi:hypothetical protein